MTISVGAACKIFENRIVKLLAKKKHNRNGCEIFAQQKYVFNNFEK